MLTEEKRTVNVHLSTRMHGDCAAHVILCEAPLLRYGERPDQDNRPLRKEPLYVAPLGQLFRFGRHDGPVISQITLERDHPGVGGVSRGTYNVE